MLYLFIIKLKHTFACEMKYLAHCIPKVIDHDTT